MICSVYHQAAENLFSRHGKIHPDGVDGRHGNDIRLKFRTAVRVTVPVTDGWPEDAIACTQSAQTEFSGGFSINKKF